MKDNSYKFRDIKVIEVFRGTRDVAVSVNSSNMLFLPTQDLLYVEDMESDLVDRDIPYVLAQLNMVTECLSSSMNSTNGASPKSIRYREHNELRTYTGYVLFTEGANVTSKFISRVQSCDVADEEELINE